MCASAKLRGHSSYWLTVEAEKNSRNYMMNPDIIYVHTGPDSDQVSALWVSIYSVRRASPASRIRCIAAEDEVSELDSMVPSMLKGYFEWVPVATPPGDPVYRNRWLKTQLVKWLQGPSLYLDSDTLVVEPFAWGELSSFSFATALNRVSDQEFKEAPTRINGIKKFATAGWEWDSRLDGFYRNGGVMYIRPEERVDSIFSAWHQKWLEFVSLSGTYLDQPSLNLTLLEKGWSERLPDCWNAPVRELPGSCRGAYIHHYYSSLDASGDSHFILFGKLVQMMSEGRFEPAFADTLLKRGRVYVDIGGRIKGYLLAGQYCFALRAILRKCLRRGPGGKK